MRYFCYDEYPEGIVTVSEEDIRKSYYPYWYSKMCKKYGKSKVDDNWCFSDCIDDWLVVNGGWKV